MTAPRVVGPQLLGVAGEYTFYLASAEIWPEELAVHLVVDLADEQKDGTGPSREAERAFGRFGYAMDLRVLRDDEPLRESAREAGRMAVRYRVSSYYILPPPWSPTSRLALQLPLDGDAPTVFPLV